MKLLLTALFMIYTASCADDNPRYSAEQAQEDIEDHDRDKELESLKEEKAAQDADLDASGAYLWTIDQIQDEQYFCEDDHWNIMDDPARFCMCRTEMLSVRWDYEDYLHHPYSYVDHLERSGRLDRCTEPSKFSEPDPADEIEEDSEFVAGEGGE